MRFTAKSPIIPAYSNMTSTISHIHTEWGGGYMRFHIIKAIAYT